MHDEPAAGATDPGAPAGRFYARLVPGSSADLATPLELVVHLPRKASGVVVRLWEKATYAESDGALVEERGGDALLLELHGDLEPDPALRRRGRSKLVVTRVVHPPRDATTPQSTLRVTVEGDPTMYEATVPSTGRSFEIALTIEHGGAEVFRSNAPTFIRPALRVVARRVLAYVAGDGELDLDDDEVQLAGHYATLGTATATADADTLVVTGFAMIDEAGRLRPCDADGAPLPGDLIVLRTHNDLFAYITPELPRIAKAIGDASISLRLCRPVQADGAIELSGPRTDHLFGFTTVLEGMP